MKKRYLVLLSLVFCGLILFVFKPTSVFADLGEKWFSEYFHELPTGHEFVKVFMVKSTYENISEQYSTEEEKERTCIGAINQARKICYKENYSPAETKNRCNCRTLDGKVTCNFEKDFSTCYCKGTSRKTCICSSLGACYAKRKEI